MNIWPHFIHSARLCVCFSLFIFVYVSECICIRASFSEIRLTRTGKHICLWPQRYRREHLGLWRSSILHPFSFHSFFSLSLLLSIHHIQRDKQSRGGRGLGPFSKDTLAMVRQRVPTVLPSDACCVWASLSQPRKHIHPPWHTRYSVHTKIQTHRQTHTPAAPPLLPFMWCPKKERAEISLESPAGTETPFCSTGTLEREMSWERRGTRDKESQRESQHGGRKREKNDWFPWFLRTKTHLEGSSFVSINDLNILNYLKILEGRVN